MITINIIIYYKLSIRNQYFYTYGQRLRIIHRKGNINNFILMKSMYLNLRELQTKITIRNDYISYLSYWQDYMTHRVAKSLEK